MRTQLHDSLILALDVPTLKEATEWVNRLPQVKQFKIGSQLFTAEGPGVVEMVHKKGGRVFLDLKWHDIPNTVASACREAVKMGVWMCNVHALGGAEMLKAAKEAIEEENRKKKGTAPILIAVTVLTSMSAGEVKRLGIRKSIQAEVRELAGLAKSCGLDGVVCSGHEIKTVRSACGEDFLTVVPGIRDPFERVSHSDQKRTLTPKEALAKGADYLVMGRSLLHSKNPSRLIKAIYDPTTCFSI